MSLLLILDDSPVVGVKETVAVSDEVSVSVTPTPNATTEAQWDGEWDSKWSRAVLDDQQRRERESRAIWERTREEAVAFLKARGWGRSEPPKWGEYLLYFFLPKKDREHIPGDLAEEYNTILVPKFGLASARRWYWKQVFTSVWPVVGPRLGGLLAVGGLALSWLLRTLRRLF